jgi:hypothetical protein
MRLSRPEQGLRVVVKNGALQMPRAKAAALVVKDIAWPDNARICAQEQLS